MQIFNVYWNADKYPVNHTKSKIIIDETIKKT